jgi:hypothetical protein
MNFHGLQWLAPKYYEFKNVYLAIRYGWFEFSALRWLYVSRDEHIVHRPRRHWFSIFGNGQPGFQRRTNWFWTQPALLRIISKLAYYTIRGRNFRSGFTAFDVVDLAKIKRYHGLNCILATSALSD